MNTVSGRLAADAKTSTLKDGCKVSNFTIAENERFKPKGEDEYKEIVTYYSGFL